MTDNLRLAVFDLDFTVWEPEMYQIYGPPKRKVGKNGEVKVMDKDNTPITIFQGASYALEHINKMRDRNVDIRAAVASRTDEPAWAHLCMDWLTISDGSTLTACFQHVEIDISDKKNHFHRLHKETGISFESMVFFDNERRNIISVQELGVKCVYTPDGMTKEAWHTALEMFGMKKEEF